MSFAEQEKVLFDLIFNPSLRQQFCQNGLNALTNYQLTQDEREDFADIKPEALALDAKMRTNLILSRFCRELPLSFAIASSIDNGKKILEALVDTTTMTTAANERTTVFASRLRDQLANCIFSSTEEYTMVMAVVETELGMVWTANSLKENTLKGKLPVCDTTMREHCLDKPVQIAEYVTVSIIPQSYTQLKSALCPYPLDELWKHLSDQPLSARQRSIALQNQDPRLLVVRAQIQRMSYCAPEITHHTIELSEGFAPLLQHLNGKNTINELLQQFGQAGAPEPLLKSVRNGFLQLWKSGMLAAV